MIPVNMANVDAMGAQFKHNVFKDIAVANIRHGRRLARQNAQQTPTITGGIVSGAHTTNFRTTKAGPRQPAGALPAGKTPKTPAAIQSGVTGAPALPPGRTITTPFTPGATPHSNTGSNALALPPGKYRGIATPYQGGGRVIPMSGNAAVTNRVNPTVAFSDQTSQSPINRAAFNQPSHTPFKVNTINNPKPVSIPTTPPVQQFSGAPKPDYPLHVPPAGSSTQPLPRLSAAQSQPGRPNTFTVGSRNIRGGGIAAMGSQLEAGLNSRPIGTPAKKRRV